MKTIRNLLLLCMASISILGCEELKDLASVEKDFAVSITIPALSGAGSGSGSSNPISPNLQKILDDNGLSAENAKVTLVSLSALIDMPETAKFKDLSAVEIFLNAGDKSTKVAWNTSIPESTGFSLVFNVDSDTDLINLFLEDNIRFQFVYSTRSSIEEVYLLRLNSTFKIGPK